MVSARPGEIFARCPFSGTGSKRKAACSLQRKLHPDLKVVRAGARAWFTGFFPAAQCASRLIDAQWYLLSSEGVRVQGFVFLSWGSGFTVWGLRSGYSSSVYGLGVMVQGQ